MLTWFVAREGMIFLIPGAWGSEESIAVLSGFAAYHSDALDGGERHIVGKVTRCRCLDFLVPMAFGSSPLLAACGSSLHTCHVWWVGVLVVCLHFFC